MQFMLTPDWESGANDLAQRLRDELNNGRKVLWLTSGGSNIQVTVEVMKMLPDYLTTELTIMPGDERYGQPGHADSNFESLVRAGFSKKQATFIPVLKKGLGFEHTAEEYETRLHEVFKKCDKCIAQFGIGTDGHISGILPHSAATEDTERLICAYASDPYQRLTMTFTAMKHVSAAYVVAYGDAKYDALDALKTKELPLSDQPAQILKQLKEAYVYNDQIGEDIL